MKKTGGAVRKENKKQLAFEIQKCFQYFKMSFLTSTFWGEIFFFCLFHKAGKEIIKDFNSKVQWNTFPPHKELNVAPCGLVFEPVGIEGRHRIMLFFMDSETKH